MGETEHTSFTHPPLSLWCTRKGACALPVFAQLTNKYWTDQLKPLRSPEENISEQWEFNVKRKAEKRKGGGAPRWSAGGLKHISTLEAISSPLPPLHPTPCPSVPSLPLSWLCHPSWEWVPQRHAGCKSQRQRTPSSSWWTNQSRTQNTCIFLSIPTLHLFTCNKKGDETKKHVFRKVSG